MGLPNNIYCYNCAEKGHYGDECTESRLSRTTVTDGSAFSGHNLPRQLRDAYFNMSKKRRREDRDDYKKPSKTGFLNKIKSSLRMDKKKQNRPPLGHSQSMPYIPNKGNKGGYNRAESVLDFPRGGNSHNRRSYDEGYNNRGRYDDGYGNNRNSGFRGEKRGSNKYLPSRSGFLGPKKRR
jgi:protein AIR1/2